MARKMLRAFPVVRAHKQAEDVLQNALLRMTKALREVKPETPAHFFHLVAEQVRRELLDLARHHNRRAGVKESPPPDEPPDAGTLSAEDLDRWQALHEAIQSLPAAQGEVFGLTYYHGWTQAEIAALLGISMVT
jgi:RNA polymerase sigma factor (sigma-70 family)